MSTWFGCRCGLSEKMVALSADEIWRDWSRETMGSDSHAGSGASRRQSLTRS